MSNKLQQYFPMLRARKEVLTEIENRRELQTIFYSWSESAREEFLNFTTGAKGVKMLYDFVSKEILNPETHRERVNEFLSLLLGQSVKILEVLQNDGTRLADESTLLITDIVVELEDGSIVNLEIQKVGYMFPGQRSACYSADLLLRQYKRVQKKHSNDDVKSKTYYRDIKDVYTIVLFEKSPEELKKSGDIYFHFFEQQSNTGVQLNLLQKFLFISLDIFKEIKHNESIPIKIENRREAWFAFWCMDNPEDIAAIIEKYPDFKECYMQIYDICRNIEEVMSMFSRELAELDRNTMDLMIDKMQKEIDQKKQELVVTEEKLGQTEEKLDQTTQNLLKRSEEAEYWKKAYEELLKETSI